MIPETLDAWNIDDVQHLIDAGVYESDVFDFKEMLPDPRNDDAKFRLAKTCAAFANSGGGLLIFGVKDAGPSADRLVGVDTVDFPAKFGNYPSNVSPSVDWNFRNPPLRLPSGRLVHVIHIPQSWKAPHAVEGNDQGLVSPKRTNKGNEVMSYSEVRSMYLGFYEKRLKLQLLKAEISQISSDATNMMVAPEDNDGSVYNLPTIELRLLETVLSDTYSITQSSEEFISALNSLRAIARVLNNRVDVFRSQVVIPLSNKTDIVKDHNDAIRPICEQIIELSQRSLDELADIPGVN